MKCLINFSVILLVLSSAAISFAGFTGKGHVHRISETKELFLNPQCRETDTCDLKRFTLTKVVNEIWFSDDPNHPTYGNGVIMEYETDSVAALEKYAIVQFKKGCVFHTSKTLQGKIRRNLSDVVPSFGEMIPFCFANWVIDSQDTDPAYNSDPKYGRFHLLRWNRPGSYDHRTQKFYGSEKPKMPVVYLTDNPAGAFVTGTGVRNVALEFNTCIYKASEVPVQTQRYDINFAEPINCFHWQNVYVYDFAKASFQTELAAIPPWEEPRVRADLYLVLLIITLLLALALVIFSRFLPLPWQKARHSLPGR